jgi:hypothetical protein
MHDATRNVRSSALRLLFGGVAAAAIGASLMACSDRNQPPASSFAKTEGQLLVRAKSIQWSPAPATLPAGAKIALLQGNPKEAGRYVIRVQLPANYKIPFHWVSNDMDVTVVSGALYIATTQSFDKRKAFAIKPGDFYHLPARASQLVFTKNETVLEIHGDGPYTLAYTNPADDPLKGAAAPAYTYMAAFSQNDMNDAEGDETIDMTY